MAHEIETMFYHNVEAPWHGLGVPLNEPATAAEAIQAASLDWQVKTVPVLADLGDGMTCSMPDTRAVVRDIDLSVLGTVGSRYRPIQNTESFEFFDSIIGEGQAVYETAGSLRGGKRVWILAKLPDSIRVVKDDIVDRYMLLCNSHDGTSACRVLFTPIRVVCMNTLGSALRQGKGSGCSIRHSGNIKEKVIQAQEALGLATSYFQEFTDISQHLAAKSITSQAQLETYADSVLGIPEEPSTRFLNKRADIIRRFESPANLMPSTRHTYWTAWQAFTEYVDHKKHDDKSLDSAWFGGGQKLKEKALHLALVA